MLIKTIISDKTLTHKYECSCCRPTKFEEIKILLYCPNRRFSFPRSYQNIIECDCQPCSELPNDDPMVADQPKDKAYIDDVDLPPIFSGQIHKP